LDEPASWNHYAFVARFERFRQVCDCLPLPTSGKEEAFFAFLELFSLKSLTL
jgi:hypothetical protein